MALDRKALFERHPEPHLLIWEEDGKLHAHGNAALRKWAAITKGDSVLLAIEAQANGDATFKTWRQNILTPSTARLNFAGERFEVDGFYADEFVIWRFTKDESALKEELRTLRAILELIPDMIFVKNADDLSFVRQNQAGMRVLGVSSAQEYVGKTDFDFFPEDQASFFQDMDRKVLATKSGVSTVIEPINDSSLGKRWLQTAKFVLRRKNGEPQYLVGISKDVTERVEAEEGLKAAKEHLEQRVIERTAEYIKANDELFAEVEARRMTEQRLANAEADLRRAQRLEALGRLAGGVAHDFNNLLAAMLWSSERAREQIARGDDESIQVANTELQEVEKAANRAAALTRKLLAFSRRQVLRPSRLDLHDIIQDAASILERLVGESIHLVYDLDDAATPVMADPAQISQVLINLVVNARDAMPKGGTVTISTKRGRAEDASSFQDVQLGEHVALTVRDEGHGMNEETVAQAFEPFYTTKAPGKGTGLGLATVYGIVRQSGGVIDLSSVEEKGTICRILLPLAGSKRSVKEDNDQELPVRGGKETVLLVDDEALVRRGIRAVLRDAGYEVISVPDGHAAASVLESNREIDLVLTDIAMPDISGIQLKQHLEAHYRSVPVILMSGFVGSEEIESATPIAFLQKPFRRSDLLRQIRTQLDARPPKER